MAMDPQDIRKDLQAVKKLSVVGTRGLRMQIVPINILTIGDGIDYRFKLRVIELAKTLVLIRHGLAVSRSNIRPFNRPYRPFGRTPSLLCPR
jgi:hypothetical protein